ncbi:MAG TPA: Imm8 family immunity protein [Gemmatimonadales bacterium]|nr:Imm8 family immunity protein [Gemmatimonadales bacterium]
MIYPELRDIQSLDLVPPELPPDPSDCSIRFHVAIGPRGDDAASEAYSFQVVTAAHLRRTGPRWGRGHLFLETFDWPVVVQAIAELMARCARPTWEEVADELTRELRWEIEVNGG